MSQDESTLTLTREAERWRFGGDWQPAFLAMLRNSGNIRLSCSEAGITRQAAYAARAVNTAFADAWDEALQDAIDLIEAKGKAMALQGSERLIEFFLKAHRPGVYRDTVDLRHSSPGGGPVQVTITEIVVELPEDDAGD